MRRGCCKLSRRGRQLVSLVSRGRFAADFEETLPHRHAGQRLPITVATAGAIARRRFRGEGSRGTRKPRDEGAEHVAGGGIAWFGESIAAVLAQKAAVSCGFIESRGYRGPLYLAQKTGRGGNGEGVGEGREGGRGGKGGEAGWRR